MLSGLHLIDALLIHILYLNILTMKFKPYRHPLPLLHQFLKVRKTGERERHVEAGGQRWGGRTGGRGEGGEKEMIIQGSGNFCNGNSSIVQNTWIRVFNTTFPVIIKTRATDCFRRKYKMKTEKSEELHWVVQVDNHHPPPPHVYSHTFCDLLKKTTLIYVREILFLFTNDMTDKNTLLI